MATSSAEVHACCGSVTGLQYQIALKYWKNKKHKELCIRKLRNPEIKVAHQSLAQPFFEECYDVNFVNFIVILLQVTCFIQCTK